MLPPTGMTLSYTHSSCQEIGTLTLDWSSMVGTLEPGTYFLKYTVLDNYDESEVHPLMANYYDRQSYNVVFTVE